MYGRWGFAYDGDSKRFKYFSAFSGDDPVNPTIDESWLIPDEAAAKLLTYPYDPHFAAFVSGGATRRAL